MASDVFISVGGQSCRQRGLHVPGIAVRALLDRRATCSLLTLRRVIIDAIRGCRIMILVFSPNEGVTVIPFRIEDGMPGKSLDYFIGNVHWLDAFTRPIEQHLERPLFV